MGGVRLGSATYFDCSCGKMIVMSQVGDATLRVMHEEKLIKDLYVGGGANVRAVAQYVVVHVNYTLRETSPRCGLEVRWGVGAV